jgi:iron complex transport system substrate-binding protein
MPASALAAALSVASLNLCTDEYLLLLARPQEIASVSFLSQDPQESPLWRLAQGHRSNRGSLEDVLAAKPSVVLTMRGGGRATSLIARRLGMKVVDLPPAMSVNDVSANLARVAQALGDQSRAAVWQSRLARLRATAPKALADGIWLGGGGSSLSVPSVGSEWLRLAGIRHRALNSDRVSLETLLVHPPSVLVESRYRSEQMSRGAAWLNHPIVRNVMAKRVSADGRAWTCMGPLLIGEVERLRAQLR